MYREIRWSFVNEASEWRLWLWNDFVNLLSLATYLKFGTQDKRVKTGFIDFDGFDANWEGSLGKIVELSWRRPRTSHLFVRSFHEGTNDFISFSISVGCIFALAVASCFVFRVWKNHSRSSASPSANHDSASRCSLAKASSLSLSG